MTYETIAGTRPNDEHPHEPRTIVRTLKAGNMAMMSEIGDGVFVQWGDCRLCHQRVDECRCATGPTEPAHVTRWRLARFDPDTVRRITGKSPEPGTSGKHRADIDADIDAALDKAKEAVDAAAEKASTNESSSPLELGQVLDLSVRFGNQVRHKCPRCSHYFSVREEIATCSCGMVYEAVNNGQHKVAGIPT